jgi:hypothetical protein
MERFICALMSDSVLISRNRSSGEQYLVKYVRHQKEKKKKRVRMYYQGLVTSKSENSDTFNEDCELKSADEKLRLKNIPETDMSDRILPQTRLKKRRFGVI